MIFSTTYRDIITFIPSLKKINNPSIDRIENLHFVGNFQGTIHNFITSGTIQTNLGTLVTNVSMQIPENRPAVYSGNLLTNDFQLGRFLEDSSLGKNFIQGKSAGNRTCPAIPSMPVSTEVYGNSVTRVIPMKIFL